MEEYLILTDEKDHCVGMMEKQLTHRLGLMHRAFSIFIFNTRGEILLQQRAHDKYHSGGLWSNACCGHPRFGENLTEAVERRLGEEMGMQCATHFAFSFIYKVAFENGLIENEYDHVFVGTSNDVPLPNKAEVAGWKYMSLSSMQHDIDQNPGNYSSWMKICLPLVINHFKSLELKPSREASHVSV